MLNKKMITDQLIKLNIKLKKLDNEDIETIKDKDINYENKRFLLEENSKIRLEIILKIANIEHIETEGEAMSRQLEEYAKEHPNIDIGKFN